MCMCQPWSRRYRRFSKPTTHHSSLSLNGRVPQLPCSFPNYVDIYYIKFKLNISGIQWRKHFNGFWNMKENAQVKQMCI